MNIDTADKLLSNSESLKKFMALPETDQAWLLPLLGKAERRAVAILKAINGQQKTYEEIAVLTGVNPNTVMQILRSLKDGGFEMQFDTDKVLFVGRPKRTVSLAREK